MNEAQKTEVAARYTASLRRIKKWLAIGVATAPVAWLSWKVLVPLLPSSIRGEAVFLSVIVLGLAVYAVFASLILWMVFAREKRRKVGDLT